MIKYRFFVYLLLSITKVLILIYFKSKFKTVLIIMNGKYLKYLISHSPGNYSCNDFAVEYAHCSVSFSNTNHLKEIPCYAQKPIFCSVTSVYRKRNGIEKWYIKMASFSEYAINYTKNQNKLQM